MAWLKELIGDIMTLKISTHYRTVYDTEEQELLDQVNGLKQKKKGYRSLLHRVGRIGRRGSS